MAEYGWEAMSRGRSRRPGAPPGAGRRRSLRRRMPPAGWRYDREYEAGGERYEPWWGGGPGYTGGYGYEYRRHRESGGAVSATAGPSRRGAAAGGGCGPPRRPAACRRQAGWATRPGPPSRATSRSTWARLRARAAEHPPFPPPLRRGVRQRAFAGPEVLRALPRYPLRPAPPDRWPGTGHDLDHMDEAERRMTDDDIGRGAREHG